MYHGNVNLRFVRTKKLQGGLESCSPSWNSWPHRSLSVDHRVEADWALDQREGGKAFLAIVCRGWTPCSGRLSTWSEGGRQGLLGNRLQRLNTAQRWWKIAADGSTLLAEDLQWVIDGKRGEAQGIAISEGAAQVVVRGDDGGDPERRRGRRCGRRAMAAWFGEVVARLASPILQNTEGTQRESNPVWVKTFESAVWQWNSSVWPF